MGEVVPIVIDNGASMMKAGFAGDDSPRAAFSTLIGTPIEEKSMLGIGSTEDQYIGDRAQSTRGILHLKCPIERGVITNWVGMEKIWDHAFSTELRVVTQEHPILITDKPHVPRSNREKMTEIMFESFQVPGMYVANENKLAVYSSGRNSCMDLDIGHGCVSILPVYEGYTFPAAIHKYNYGGSDVTEYLAKLLSEKGASFTTTAEKQIVKGIKEKVCYVSQDYQRDLSSWNPKLFKYELPDTRQIEIEKDAFMCTEILFNPSLIGIEQPGVHEIVYNAIMDCDIDSRERFFTNILVSGATTLFDGFVERLKKEIQKLASENARVRIVAPPERLFSVWIGGSILASLSTFQNMWITKEEYEESGTSIVHKKCYTFK
ncbi:actin-7-related [Anaeramoeba flamelloides]|uniref:Actin-7-related n=1 Tax=Anaeramoeba flamelloides TaxID=1746091 RepID=A0ABQ8YWC7_9EUKA|nr:actin-7-related [Anaeramoeba flamelloides]